MQGLHGINTTILKRLNATFRAMLWYLVAATFFSVSMASAEVGTGSSLQTGDIIAGIIKAYGGKEVLEGVRTFKISGVINAVMRRDQGTYEVYFKRNRKLVVETKYSRSFEKRILNGSKGYRGTDASPLAQVADHRYLAMVYHYKHLDLPYGLSVGAYAVSRKGKETLNGKPVEVLILTDPEGPVMDVYVDTDTFYITKVTGYFSIAEGRTANLSAEFSDFRKIDGTVFPFVMINYGSGQKIAETSMTTYEINKDIPDPFFEP